MTGNEGRVQGEVAEFAVATHLVRQGHQVSYTHGQYRYDLVVDVSNRVDTDETVDVEDPFPLYRVQVKKANQDSEKPWKYRLFTDQYQSGEVDLFAGYIVDMDEVFYVAFDDIGANDFRINTKGADEMIPSNAERANVLEEYTLERALSNVERT